MTKKHKPSLSYDLDIVIPVYGNFELLQQTVDFLPDACKNVRYKLVIVDNASPIEKPEYANFYSNLQAKYPSTKVIKNRTNVGFAGASNQGANYGRSNLILQLNSDCIMHSGSIERLVNKMEHSNVGIVAPMLIFPSDTELYNNGFSAADFVQIRPAGKVQHVGIETNINGEFYHIFVGWSVDNPKVRRMFKPYAVTGACLMTRRSIWTKTNGFDMVYGQGTWEDVDYCMKVRSMGYDIELESGAVGTHYVNASAYKYRLPMPLNENRNIFMSRWGNMIEYTEWRHL